MNTPVDFEIAKLLKEKGFPQTIISFLYYKPDGTPVDIHFAADNKDFRQFCIYRPTIAEVIMWLYENHKIWIQVYPRKYNELKLMWSYSLIKIENGYIIDGLEFPDIDTPINIPVWVTPTETFQEAIKYCLTNLL